MKTNQKSLAEMVDEANKMLAGGTDPAEVLWHFDMMLDDMMTGGQTR